ncbi:hypothetical protein BDA96_10G138200 [Sorghum bicolor]|uniref:CCHC-type domain-containing protein n=1 Tax=Sorghum bicolor TaxID=4558 RepID=A0A921Q1K3_SORBI|nr:hypothetical protein BDA96_10G138200 [Sorghum bicolor]
MASSGIDDCETHIFDGTNFALWKNHMLDHFHQKVLFELDCEAYCYLMKSLSFELFDRINSKGTAYEMWESIKHTFGDSSTWDDDKFKKEEPKVEIHEDVKHDHNKVVVEDCSTSWSSEDEDDGYESDASTSSSTSSHSSMSHSDGKVSIGGVIVDCDGPNFELTTCEQQKHLLYVTTCSHEELKLVHEELCVTHDNLKHVSTSCDVLLSIPCSSHLDICSTSMSCETNLLKENNKLNEQVKNLSNKLERCYNSKVTFEHILKTQRNYGDKCGLGFKKKMTKGKRKQEREKLSHFMCYQCHEMGHLANGCPNKEKLKKIKEEERLKHVKCFKCRTWGHLTSMCPTKQLVKQQEEPQPKPQVEQEKKPQAQVKFNHHGDLMMKKKKTRRGGRARHPMQIQDAKMMSKNDGHFASKCPTKLEKKAQATFKRQGNEKQHMSKEEKAQSKRSCYLCRERGHMAHSCPLGTNSKPISIDDNHNMLRKDGDGTSMVAIAKHPATHTKAMPKYVAPNLRGPKLVWVPSKSG